MKKTPSRRDALLAAVGLPALFAARAAVGAVGAPAAAATRQSRTIGFASAVAVI